MWRCGPTRSPGARCAGRPCLTGAPCATPPTPRCATTWPGARWTRTSTTRRAWVRFRSFGVGLRFQAWRQVDTHINNQARHFTAPALLRCCSGAAVVLSVASGPWASTCTLSCHNRLALLRYCMGPRPLTGFSAILLLYPGAIYLPVLMPSHRLHSPAGPILLSLTVCLGCAVQHLLLGARQRWQEPRGGAGSAEGKL